MGLTSVFSNFVIHPSRRAQKGQDSSPGVALCAECPLWPLLAGHRQPPLLSLLAGWAPKASLTMSVSVFSCFVNIPLKRKCKPEPWLDISLGADLPWFSIQHIGVGAGAQASCHWKVLELTWPWPESWKGFSGKRWGVPSLLHPCLSYLLAIQEQCSGLKCKQELSKLPRKLGGS